MRYILIGNEDYKLLEQRIAREIYEKTNGPKFCKHCNKIQAIQVYELSGSEEIQFENNVVTRSFTGSQVCRVCNKIIEQKTN